MKANKLIPALTTAIQCGFNSLVKGKPGVGKSDIIEQIANKLAYDIMICHPVVDESIDYKGLPCNNNGVAEFLPYGNLLQMINADKPLIVFFDDLGQASQSVQAACMQLLLARQINGKKISNHVRFVAATNSRKDNAGVTGLITPLLSRFNLITELEVDADLWKIWAINNNMPMELISFINFRPQLLEGKTLKTENGETKFVDTPVTKEIENFACPRTIANLGKWINAGITDLSVWEGCVGTSFAIEFAAFYKTYKSLAGLPEKVILNPLGTEIPTNQATLFALVGALTNKASEKNFDPILEYINRVPSEFQVFFMKDAMIKNDKLMECDSFIKWSTLNPDFIK